MCQNSAEHLGGSPIVVEDPSEPFPALDVASHGGHASLIVDQLVVDSLVIALYVVVLRVLLHGVVCQKSAEPEHAQFQRLTRALDPQFRPISSDLIGLNSD